MKNAENVRSCPQRDSTECEGYAGAQSAVQPGKEETAGRSQKLLEAILYRDNLNRAYKRVKANKGAPGVDGMTVEEALPWLKEHGKEMSEAIRSGKYKPTAVRRKEIPKPDGGVRKLGIPTVKDRIVQQAIAQQLMPQYEPKFSEGSYGYRPGRSAQDAIFKIRGYADEGYEWAVQGECDEELQVSGLCIRQRKGWTVHSCPSQSPAESEEQAARNHEAKPRSQRPKGHAGNKGLHDRMAELLRDSVPKDENAGMGRMAAAPNPCKHLEAMETGGMTDLTTLMDVKKIKKYAKAVHANGGVVICSLTLSAPWILTKLEPYCDAILVNFASVTELAGLSELVTITDLQLQVLSGAIMPTGKLPVTLPSCTAVLEVTDTEIDGVVYELCASPNDVPGYDKDQYIAPEVLAQSPSGSYAYQDEDGNTYKVWFGLTY